MGKWTCQCGQENVGKFCTSCGNKKQEIQPEMSVQATDSNEWICSCGAHNKMKFCTTCGKKRESGEAVTTSVAPSTPSTPPVEPVRSVTPPSNNNVPPAKQGTLKRGPVDAQSTSASPADKLSGITKGISSSLSGIASKDWGKIIGDKLQLLTSKLQGMNKTGLIAVVAVVLIAVMGYFGYGKYMEYGIESKYTAYAEVLTEINGVMEGLDNLTGEKDDQARQTAIDTLNKDIEKLNELSAYFREESTKNDKTINTELWLTTLDDNVALLNDAVKILSYDGPVKSPWGDDAEEEFHRAVSDASKQRDKIIKDWSFFNKEGILLDGKKPDDIFQVSAVMSHFSKYLEHKNDVDVRITAEKTKAWTEKREAANNALLQKNEVVFLVDFVAPNEDNSVTIQGHFHNGTTDLVSGIQSMLVDVTLKNDDTEASTVKDYAYEDPYLNSLTIPADGNSASYTFKVPTELTRFDWNNAEAHVHKTRWKVRRVVRR